MVNGYNYQGIAHEKYKHETLHLMQKLSLTLKCTHLDSEGFFATGRTS
jgi:hypothetical protein